MNFEKLNDNKIKITFTIDDMVLNNISSNTFLCMNSFSQKLLQSIIEKAEKDFGFNTDNCNLIVEAITSPEGGIVFTITKLLPFSERIIDANFFLKLNCFDDFLNMCSHLINMDLFSYEDILENFSLFLYKNTYYMTINLLCENILLNSLVEFGDIIPYSPRISGLLNEYGKEISIKNGIV